MKRHLTLLTFDGSTDAAAASRRDGGADTSEYAITLCAVTGPIPLPPLRSPLSKEVKFFFRRHRENGRERHWLQIGYFSSREEAERALKSLRGTYPWAVVSERISHP